ncbi:MAG: non-homologous end-joining DNA ligase, partial [Leifsonia flava]
MPRAGSLADLGNGPEWAIEMKWDGIRAIASIEGDSVRLMTRNGNDVTAAYPELIALSDVAHVRSGVFDGEIVATDAAGRPDFGLLQERMNLVKPGEIEAARKRRPVRLFLFDVLELDGEDLTAHSYSTRRAQLAKVIDAPRGSPIAVPDAFDGDAESAIEFSRNLGLEGIVAKETGSHYEEGRRSGVWIKIKHLSTQEVVIGGWRTGKGNRAGTFGSLLVGLPTPEGLRYVGRVGSGLRDQDLARVMKRLEPLAQTENPFISVPREDAVDAHWVAPTLVG